MPTFNLIERTLGNEIHKAVFHGNSPTKALKDAENSIFEELRDTAKTV